MLRRALSRLPGATYLRRQTASRLHFFSTSASLGRTFHACPPLPAGALSDDMALSSSQVQSHWNLHQKKYFDDLNRLLLSQPTDIQNLSLDALVRASSSFSATAPELAHAAAMAHNHVVHFESLDPEGFFSLAAHGHLALRATHDFGSPGDAVVAIKDKALSRLGQGWVFFVCTPENKLAVEACSDGESPLVNGNLPLVGFDLNERAFAGDYGSDGASYVDCVIREMLNWDRAEILLARQLHATGGCAHDHEEGGHVHSCGGGGAGCG